MNVHVVGGGIGGLAFAIGLVRRGITPVVHESARELLSVGAGISLGANAMAALDRLDLADAVHQRGAEISRLRVIDPRGRTLRVVDLTADSHPHVYVHRAILQNILVDALPPGVLRLSTTCSEVHPGSLSEPFDGEGLSRITFEDGGTANASVVVGADGINSVVRRSIIEHDPRRETGTVTYRGIVPYETALTAETVQVWGSGTRVGVAPLDDGRCYWFATVNGHIADRTNPSAVLRALQKRYRQYPAPVPAVIDRTVPEALVTTSLSDLEPLSEWSVDNVVLLGDAAHAPLPYLGQGAGQALEDAVTLSHRLDTESPSVAIDKYERIRKRRADRVLRLSRIWGRIAQLEGPLARGRNLLVKCGPQAVADKHQHWLATPRF